MWQAAETARSLCQGNRLEQRLVREGAVGRCLLSVEEVSEQEGLVLLRVRGCTWVFHGLRIVPCTRAARTASISLFSATPYGK